MIKTTVSRVEEGQIFVWAFKDGQEYRADVFLALENSDVKRENDWKFRVKIIASTDSSQELGCELLIHPDYTRF